MAFNEVIEKLVEQAWTLTEDQIESIHPQNYHTFVNDKRIVKGPFSDLSPYQIENPDEHLLDIMRKPEFFPFTCYHLFNKPDGEPHLEIAPFQHLMLRELWTRQFPMILASRGASKSFTLALYSLLRLLFTPGSKIIIVGSAFRQAKVIFDYMERIWYTSPVFRDLVCGSKNIKGRDNGPKKEIDRCEFTIGESIATVLPLGADGQKIRGMRAHYTLADEMASIQEDVYARVIQGFGVVSSDPVRNMKDYARMRVLQRLGLWTKGMEEDEVRGKRGNQSVISGTAYYTFNHFYKYWREYRDIIQSAGDKKKLEEVFKGPIPDGFDWRDYSIIRLPYQKIPGGYMDEKTIIRAKQTTTSSTFLMEFGACFPIDSDGFFKRSLIEKCVVGKPEDENPVTFESCGRVKFSAKLIGLKECSYYYGVDPASERDKFAVVIVEAWPDHRRVVYCWTTDKSDHREKIKKSRTDDNDFYKFCTRKLRDLFVAFPPAEVLVDAGGGGIAIREAFRDKDKLKGNEKPLYEVIEEGVEKDTDDLEGDHFLRMVNFRDNKWLVGANYGMKKDLEDRLLLFPLLDSLAVGMAMEEDKAQGRVIQNDDGAYSLEIADTLESNMLEIEELKDELASIVISSTNNGLERWDTPDSSVAGKKKNRMRKDRYSALLMANMGARSQMNKGDVVKYNYVVGGFASSYLNKKTDGSPMYIGPPWFTNQMKWLG